MFLDDMDIKDKTHAMDAINFMASMTPIISRYNMVKARSTLYTPWEK